MQFHEKIFGNIWFHEFFCLEFLKFSGPLWNSQYRIEYWLITYFAPFPVVEEITLLQGGVHTFVLNDDESDAEPDLIDFVLTKGKI